MGVPVSVTVDQTGLTPGQYFGFVSITSPGALNSPLNVSVLLNVGAAGGSGPAGIQPSTGGVLLTGAAGSATAAQAQVTLFNPSGSTVAFTSKTAGSWLSLSPSSGSVNPGGNPLTVNANLSALAGGIQSGTITLSYSDGTSGTIDVVVIATGSSTTGAHAVSGCSAGKPGSLIGVFDDPLIQQVTQVGQDRRDVTLERACVGNLLLGADPGGGVDHERLARRPVTVDGGLRDPRPAGHLIDSEAADPALAEQFEGGHKHPGPRPLHPAVDRGGVAF